MPFTAGGLSVRRFAVLGELDGNLSQTATHALRRYCWRPIDDERGERESFGWVNPRRILDEKFDYTDVTSNNVMLIGARRDRKTFSNVLFRARLAERMGEVKKERKIERITRQHRLALEEELAVIMLKETSAVSTFHEVAWDLDRRELYMGATGNGVTERIKDLFEATFDLRLLPKFPSTIGADHIAAQGLEEEFQSTLSGNGKAVGNSTPWDEE